LKHYAKIVFGKLLIHLIPSIITFVPRENNKKVDSLAITTSLFNDNDSQNPNTFHVKKVFHPSILDNQDHWKVFENDEHVSNFLADLLPIDPDKEKN
jgi:hypothetical protein